MVTPLVSQSDGPRLTVNDFIKDPLRIPQLILDMTKNEFIVDSVLRNAGNNQAGAVRFYESTPLYADGDPDIRSEGGEVPVVTTSIGKPNVAFTYERAMAIRVTDEMRRRQVVDPVTRQLTQVRNTMARSWNKAFLDMTLANPNVQTLALASGSAWDDTNATANYIRGTLADAIYLVENAATDDSQDSNLGFEADTLLINHVSKLTLFKSEDFAKPYIGNVASESLQYKGTLPRKIMNLDVMVSRQIPVGTAIVMQRNRCGFISDELPMQATPLYRDEPRKTSRSDVQRAAAMGLDQPKAIVVMTGVDSGEPTIP